VASFSQRRLLFAKEHLPMLAFYQIWLYLKQNEILSFAGKWMEPEIIILSEVNQVQKAKGHMFSLKYKYYTYKYKYKHYS
jgi:hypothetical protein